MADSTKNTLTKLLDNIPDVLNKTAGTQNQNTNGLPGFKLTGASNNVNTLGAIANQTDFLLSAIDSAEQETLIGVSPVAISNMSQIAENIDQVANPGYLFNLTPVNPSNANFLGYPRNLNQTFYITIKNAGLVNVTFSTTYGNFDDGTTIVRALYVTSDSFYVYVIYVHQGNYTLAKFSMFGNLVFSVPLNFSAAGITTDGTYLYITDNFNNCVNQYLSDLTYISSWGSTGNGNTNLFEPQGLTYFNGYLYICDSGNNRIVKLPAPLPTPATACTATWGFGILNVPFAVTATGTSIFITDQWQNVLFQVDQSLPAGVYIATWGSTGSGNTNLRTPLGIATDGNYVYVDDSENIRVMKIAIPLIPTNPGTPWAVPDSVEGSPTGISFIQSFNYNDIIMPVLLNCDQTVGFFLTDTSGNSLPSIPFKISTPKTITFPSGGLATLQYTPNAVNPYTIPGIYTLIQASWLPTIPENYSVTTDIGADGNSYTYQGNLACLDSVGTSFGVPRLLSETDSLYKNRIKYQAFGNIATLPGITTQLLKIYPQNTYLKVYEGFTQAGVNTGFSNMSKNTSGADLKTFLTSFPGYPITTAVWSLNANTGVLSPVSIAPFVSGLSSFNPYTIYITFLDASYNNRGVFSGGDNSGSSTFTPTAPIGSFDDLYTKDAATNGVAAATAITATFNSNGTPQTYGGFLDAEIFAVPSDISRLAFLVNAIKAAGIQVYIVQLL